MGPTIDHVGLSVVCAEFARHSQTAGSVKSPARFASAMTDCQDHHPGVVLHRASTWGGRTAETGRRGFGHRSVSDCREQGKSRLVPLQSDLAEILREYLRERTHAHGACSDCQPFFVCSSGAGLTVKSISETLRRMMRRAGLKPLSGRRGPRPCDLRHAFAVGRLTEW
jgi:integrase